MRLTIPSSATAVGRLLRLPLRLIPTDAVLPILSGPMRGRLWIAGSGTHSCWMGTYEREQQALFRQIVGRGAVVYDIGANVGFYTLLASELVGPSGRVLSFEPLPRNLDLLRRHLEINRRGNVVVVNAAIADYDGLGRFSASTAWSENMLNSDGEIAVSVISLDSYVRAGGRAPTIMKIDVEGAEHLVLAGARSLLRDVRPSILLSIHSAEAREGCLTALKAARYGVRAVGGGESEENASLLFVSPS